MTARTGETMAKMEMAIKEKTVMGRANRRREKVKVKKKANPGAKARAKPKEMARAKVKKTTKARAIHRPAKANSACTSVNSLASCRGSAGQIYWTALLPEAVAHTPFLGLLRCPVFDDSVSAERAPKT